ncbi:hypothetical protein PHLGIDRAFT_291449 [Phlebiopsis gigantea 11061_1 CR5-6]|uniref:Uncharacterized protein n=1 Tax=Phlebiopsis gigantea (strain 11061_1 CR5-6) TaxID=745531 RepID=A0A0C3NDC1_PHLG1|nr:hypothetical protein PHLGIDRAFT_291449 [Phlebiopsis gigantea 11061_1 CR5-6]
MALAAVPPTHSAFSREPVWDGAIVPALRKRLESESQELAKRMSVASMTSVEEYPTDALASSSSQTNKERSETPTSLYTRPSAIPRPSLQMTRPGESASTATERTSGSSSFQRSRTLSQPFPFDASGSQSPPPLPSDSASRSNSPLVSASRITRIPVSRVRTGSTSSANQQSFSISLNSRGDNRNGLYKSSGNAYAPELSTDLFPVDESHSYLSHSTPKSMKSQVSEIVNERPPFNPSIASTRRGYDDDFATPRMSTDSEERPFEHWYRGDVSRNGGVGELRVGRKQEMLDIANYGHTLRQAPSQGVLSTSSRSRSNSRGRDASYSRMRHRPRAESLGHRGSIYIQDEKVLDERPLTDLDNDDDDEADEGYYDDDGMDVIDSYVRDVGAVSPPHSLERSDTPTLVESTKSNGFKSRIPTPTPRAITPTSTHPLSTDGLSVPKATSPPPSQLSIPKAALPAATTPAAKRKAKSPAPHTSKRTRQKPPAKVPKKKEERPRDSAHYPAPEGDDIMHAVPSWTQPVPQSGNWDDVVIPVVARKKGLDDHYQQADGSPKPKRKSNVIEPAPGTFGFDHTKYRGTRADRQSEDISMYEFGERKETLTVQTENLPNPGKDRPSPSPSPSPLSPPSRVLLSGSPRAESPAPFSQYPVPEPSPIPEIRVIRPSTDNQKVEMHPDEEASGGCCKCIIM